MQQPAQAKDALVSSPVNTSNSPAASKAPPQITNVNNVAGLFQLVHTVTNSVAVEDDLIRIPPAVARSTATEKIFRAVDNLVENTIHKSSEVKPILNQGIPAGIDHTQDAQKRDISSKAAPGV